MSVHAMSWAWRQPVKDDGDFRLLLSLADLANDEGATVASHSSLRGRLGDVSQSTVQRRVKRLVEAGLVLVEEREKSSGVRDANAYHLVMGDQVPLFTGDQDDLVTDDQARSRTLERGKGSRRQDLAFEALVETTGSNVSMERGAINRALAAIREVPLPDDVDLPGEIRRRAELWSEMFPDAALTATALAKHWVRLGSFNGRTSRFARRRGGVTAEEAYARASAMEQEA